MVLKFNQKMTGAACLVSTDHLQKLKELKKQFLVIYNKFWTKTNFKKKKLPKMLKNTEN